MAFTLLSEAAHQASHIPISTNNFNPTLGTVTITIAPDNTCNFDDQGYAFLTCTDTEIRCSWESGRINRAFCGWDDIWTTCLDSSIAMDTHLCGEACTSNPLINWCTSTDNPICITMDFGNGIHYYDCGTNSYRTSMETSQPLEAREFSTMILVDGVPLSTLISSFTTSESETIITATTTEGVEGVPDSNSGILGSTIPGLSRFIALLSVIPVLLVIVGLLVRCCISCRVRRKTTNRSKPSQRRWKPASLQYGTLLIYLGFILMLIVLLESASLALPKRQASEATQPISNINNQVVETMAEILATRIKSHDFEVIPTTMSEPSGPPPTAPPSPIGWLLLDKNGWLSADSAYFIGTFVPTLLASIFAIPWKILDLETKSLEPFAQLACPGGGRVSQTLLLQYNNVSGLFSAFMGLSAGHSAVALSTYLKYSAALLSPLAAESVRLTLHGECLQDSTKHCTATLQATDPVIRAAQAVLSAMACFVIAYIILLRGRTFGASSDPRSILGIASLSLNPYLSAHMRRISLGSEGMFSATRAAATLGNRKFMFGYVTYPSGQQEYGIIIVDDIAGEPDQVSDPPPLAVGRRVPKQSMVSGILVKVIGFAIFILGLIILILYYRLTYNKGSGFEKFMDSQTFGIRFLFTVFGVVIGFGWAFIFNELAITLPAWDMSRPPTKPEHSIMMPLSPNPYVGMMTYLHRRHKLLALVSIVTVLCDFLPILLANIPFSNAITWATFNVCTWLSVGVLGFLLVVLAVVAGVILFSSPSHHFPFASTDWGTLAAVLYLTCRSADYLAQLQSLSGVGKTEMERRMKTLNARYSIISVVGEGGDPHVTIQVVY